MPAATPGRLVGASAVPRLEAIAATVPTLGASAPSACPSTIRSR